MIRHQSPMIPQQNRNGPSTSLSVSSFDKHPSATVLRNDLCNAPGEFNQSAQVSFPATVTPDSSTSTLAQFEDASEDGPTVVPTRPPMYYQRHKSLYIQDCSPPSPPLATTKSAPIVLQRQPSSLDALAMVCDAENSRATTDGTVGTLGTMSTNGMDESSACSTPVVSNTGACVLPSNSSAAVVVEGTVVVQGSAAGAPGNNACKISRSDVLCGRGGLTNHHPGNVVFRKLVRAKQEEYLRASKRDKAGVARCIVDTIRSLDPPGRFLKKDPSNPGMWVEIGDRKAREKTSQALREGAPELREELLTEQVGSKVNAEGGSAAVSAEPPMRVRVVSSEDVKPQLLQVQQLQPSAVLPASSPESYYPQDFAGPHWIADPPQHATSSPVPMDTSNTSYTAVVPLSGTKRKLEAHHPSSQQQQCSIQESRAYGGENRSVSSSSKAKSGGPRLKMLKARMMRV